MNRPNGLKDHSIIPIMPVTTGVPLEPPPAAKRDGGTSQGSPKRKQEEESDSSNSTKKIKYNYTGATNQVYVRSAAQHREQTARREHILYRPFNMADLSGSLPLDTSLERLSNPPNRHYPYPEDSDNEEGPQLPYPELDEEDDGFVSSDDDDYRMFLYCPYYRSTAV